MVTRNLLLSTARVYLVIIAVKCCNILLMHCWQRLVVWLSGNAANAFVSISVVALYLACLVLVQLTVCGWVNHLSV